MGDADESINSEICNIFYLGPKLMCLSFINNLDCLQNGRNIEVCGGSVSSFSVLVQKACIFLPRVKI